jgi:hypothetical protein
VDRTLSPKVDGSGRARYMKRIQHAPLKGVRFCEALLWSILVEGLYFRCRDDVLYRYLTDGPQASNYVRYISLEETKQDDCSAKWTKVLCLTREAHLVKTRVDRLSSKSKTPIEPSGFHALVSLDIIGNLASTYHDHGPVRRMIAMEGKCS